MNRIRRRVDLKPPEDWDTIRDTLIPLNDEMRAAEAFNNDARSSQEQLWSVLRANWKRSRPVFEMFWREKTMSSELYEWILNQGFADRELINSWRKPGYDRLCCVACVSRNTDHGGVCLCRIPKEQRNKPEFKCFHCGCPGCCSGDYDAPEDELEAARQTNSSGPRPHRTSDFYQQRHIFNNTRQYKHMPARPKFRRKEPTRWFYHPPKTNRYKRLYATYQKK